MICACCGKNFEPTFPYQKYCSRKCRNTLNNLHYRRNVPLPPRVPFEFVCAHCGKTVIVAAHGDKRFKYCSLRCCNRHNEKLKEERRKRLRGNNGMSGGMSLRTLIRRERRDLE